jgi:ubiquinone/menaquinone biosynthesis C-methylase UbiE
MPAFDSGGGSVPSSDTYDPQSFDHLAGEYDFVASLERSSAFYLKHLPHQRRRALDVGCGTGILAHDLSHYFDTVLAIDISEPMLAIARRKRPAPNIEYRREDANHLVLHQTFDFIVSHTTFHHLEDITETLRMLKAVLEPGGCLVIVDNVRRWPMIPRASFLLAAKACLKLPLDVVHHGRSSASRLFRFRTSRHWLDHLRTDTHLPPARFRKVYAESLPGASFTPLRYFLGVVWQSPHCGTTTTAIPSSRQHSILPASPPTRRG